MTVIFSNMMDEDCSLLPEIWKDIEDVRLVEIRPGTEDFELEAEKAMREEQDTIVFAGHGTQHGLLAPTPNFDTYVLHEGNCSMVRARNVICIFCHAAQFCKHNNLHAFATSMFISNRWEALSCLGTIHTQDEINQDAARFYRQANGLLRENAGTELWMDRLAETADRLDPVDSYNRDGIMLT